jgi:hypothetical protein
MKYLKKYENIFSNINSKFIIIKSNRLDIKYYILKIVDKDELLLYYSDFYFFYEESENKEIQKRHKKNDISAIDESSIDEILYQTNNLQDAIKKLTIIRNIDKYNI